MAVDGDGGKGGGGGVLQITSNSSLKQHFPSFQCILSSNTGIIAPGR